MQLKQAYHYVGLLRVTKYYEALGKLQIVVVLGNYHVKSLYGYLNFMLIFSSSHIYSLLMQLNVKSLRERMRKGGWERK